MTLVATQVKRRRGTNDENDAFAGAEGEITVDLTNKELRVHDGSGKKGGFRVGHYSYSSNCITEIPQDIKLELNNGTLTLKSGSKVYIPNGSGVFDTLPIGSDYIISNLGTGTYTKMLVVKSGQHFAVDIGVCFSGSSAPTGHTYAIWYDTTNNKVKTTANGGSTWTDGWSFPIAIVSITSDAISSIDQVFNGFGYIGSTVFALPNVKGLNPQGLNADGTLKNNIATISSVKVKSDGVAYKNRVVMFSFGALQLNELKVFDDTPKVSSVAWCYSIKQNKLGVYNPSNQSWTQPSFVCAGTVSATTGGKITSLNIKTAFHTVDYNDTEYIAHQSMPSGRYIDLTLGASDSTYTAPADGWVVFGKVNGTSEQRFVQLENRTQLLRSRSFAPYSSNSIFVFIPVCRGDIFSTAYDCIGDTMEFRFVYANGSK